MAKVTIKLNHSGMKALLNDPGLGREVLSHAERGAESARSTAVVDSGRYRDSIHAWPDKTDRVVGRYGSDVDYASIIEANTGNLARSLDAAG